MVGNWNTWIQRAKGSLIHILHQDDFVANGYYREIKNLADNYPGVGLYSTRTFYVDEQSLITGVTGRARELEQPAKAPVSKSHLQDKFYPYLLHHLNIKQITHLHQVGAKISGN